jgi:sialate O-acetylesterase
MRKASLLLSFLFACFSLIAQVSMPRVFSDHMVLQRNKPINVWGWAKPGEKITIALAGSTQTTKADKKGDWKVSLPQLEAGGPHELVVKGTNTLTFKDVLIGEVWLCSGQSNMEWTVKSSMNAAQEIKNANYPTIRHIKVPNTTSLNAEKDIRGGEWKVCTPENADDFTAVGYFFAREINKQLNVPIGLINSSWGGTNVETWISPASFFGNSEFTLLKSKMPANLDSISNKRKAVLNKMIADVQGSLPSSAESNLFSKGDYNDTSWKSMKLPTLWESAGLPSLDGVVWFRRQFNLPADMNLSNAVLSLGPIDDNDSTFVNGVFIGRTNSYNEDRNYKVPPGILKTMNNTIAVKVVDGGGGGGIYGTPDQLAIRIGGVEASLAGDWKFRIAQVEAEGNSVNPNSYPTLLYNAMINPLLNYNIRGALWYQGESNAGRALQYKTSFPLMITDWRKQWKEDFPFYFVQLTSFQAGGGNNQNGGSEWAELREAQQDALRLPNTGMAVIVDIGESKDIHPKNKQDVGKRLAANALSKTYGVATEYSGPLFQSIVVQGNKAIISYTHADGLEVKNKYGYINGFEIAGEDQKFYYAKAWIEGGKVVVSADAVAKPVAVRYAWADDPNDVNLFNKQGLPATPFRTDHWTMKTQNGKYEIQ